MSIQSLKDRLPYSSVALCARMFNIYWLLVRGHTASQYHKRYKLSLKTMLDNNYFCLVLQNMPATRSKKDFAGLHIGWLHKFKTAGFKTVTAKKGGGIRIIQIKNDDTMSLDSILELGKKLFFPKGKSPFGQFTDMKVELSSVDGVTIEQFTDLDGNECSMAEYLKARGIYPSQFYIYLKTELRNEKKENVDELKAEVDGNLAESIRIKYTKEKHSNFSDATSELSFYSMYDCWTMSEKIEEFEKYNPLLDGYKVTSVSVGEKVYYEVDKERDSVILHEPIMDNDVFMYPPHLLCGIEEAGENQNYIILGTILKGGNNQTIHWFKNDENYMSGEGLSAIKIHEDGMYTCGVYIGPECKIVYPPVSVKVPDRKTLQPQMEQQSSIPINVSILEQKPVMALTEHTFEQTFESVSQVDQQSSIPINVSILEQKPVMALTEHTFEQTFESHQSQMEQQSSIPDSKSHQSQMEQQSSIPDSKSHQSQMEQQSSIPDSKSYQSQMEQQLSIPINISILEQKQVMASEQSSEQTLQPDTKNLGKKGKR